MSTPGGYTPGPRLTRAPAPPLIGGISAHEQTILDQLAACGEAPHQIEESRWHFEMEDRDRFEDFGS